LPLAHERRSAKILFAPSPVVGNR